MTKVKIRGNRSIETKLMRLACELREDARRVRADYEGSELHDRVANSLDDVARKLSSTADLIMRGR